MTGNAEIVGLQSAMDVHEKFSQAAAQAKEQEGLAMGLRARKGQATHEEITMDEKTVLEHSRDSSVLSNTTTECGDHHHSKEGSRFEDEAEALLRVERMHPRKSRFDVDIVSKLVVYAGIGALAVDGIPILFALFGLSSSPVRI